MGSGLWIWYFGLIISSMQIFGDFAEKEAHIDNNVEPTGFELDQSS